jgi:hypothetical protein
MPTVTNTETVLIVCIISGKFTTETICTYLFQQIKQNKTTHGLVTDWWTTNLYTKIEAVTLVMVRNLCI